MCRTKQSRRGSHLNGDAFCNAPLPGKPAGIGVPQRPWAGPASVGLGGADGLLQCCRAPFALAMPKGIGIKFSLTYSLPVFSNAPPSTASTVLSNTLAPFAMSAAEVNSSGE